MVSGCRAREFSACGAGRWQDGCPIAVGCAPAFWECISIALCWCSNGISCWHFLYNCLSFSSCAKACHSRYSQLLLMPSPDSEQGPELSWLLTLPWHAVPAGAAGCCWCRGETRGCICPCVFCRGMKWNLWGWGGLRCPGLLHGDKAVPQSDSGCALQRRWHWRRGVAHVWWWLGWVSVHSQGRAAEQVLGAWAVQGPESGRPLCRKVRAQKQKLFFRTSALCSREGVWAE